MTQSTPELAFQAASMINDITTSFWALAVFLMAIATVILNHLIKAGKSNSRKTSAVMCILTLLFGVTSIFFGLIAKLILISAAKNNASKLSNWHFDLVEISNTIQVFALAVSCLILIGLIIWKRELLDLLTSILK